jgi:hypothetical protein
MGERLFKVTMGATAGGHRVRYAQQDGSKLELFVPESDPVRAEKRLLEVLQEVKDAVGGTTEYDL